VGLLVLGLLLVIAVAAIVVRTNQAYGWTLPRWTPALGPKLTPVSLTASGIIEADELSVASEYGGLVVSIPAAQPADRPGKRVRAGDPLVQLDTTLIDARIEAAQASVALAEAILDQAQAGSRPGQIAVARAELAQAEQARLAAVQAVSDTIALLRNPQDIRLQIALLEAQIEAEQHRLDQNLALKNAAEIAKDAFKEGQDRIDEAGGPGRHRVEAPGAPGGYVYYTVPSLPLEAHLAPNRWWQAWIGVNATAANKEGMEAALAQLYARLENPQAFQAQADEAQATLAQADAQILAAQAQLAGLEAGTTAEQIAALQARVLQAQAALDALLSSRAMRTVRAPTDGVVLEIMTQRGEIAAPGAPLLTLADLSHVRLTVYVPEPELGQIQLGQSVQARVDSFPSQRFQGHVTHIADRAEFTPRNVATSEERANLVFAVEIDLPNEEGALKPGMPADAVWKEEG
jgi:HlyD family secretion protein